MGLLDRKPVGIALAVALTLLLEAGISPLDWKRLLLVALVSAGLLLLTAVALERFVMHQNVLLRGAVIAWTVFSAMFARVALDRFDILWTTYLVTVALGMFWMYRMFKPARNTLEA